MTNKETLITEIKPDQLASYGNLLVAFYDSFKTKLVDDGKGGKKQIKESVLYIHIQNSSDKYSIIKQKSGIRRNKQGAVAEEKQLFARAYAKYLELKQNGGKAADPERDNMVSQLEAQKARIAELEAAFLEKKETKKEETKKEEVKKETKREAKAN